LIGSSVKQSTETTGKNMMNEVWVVDDDDSIRWVLSCRAYQV